MIEINNLTREFFKNDFFKKTAEIVLKGEKKKNLDLSIALIGRAEMKRLNQKYRKKNRATDVLSLFYGDLGEILICPKVVKKNAKYFKVSFKKELAKTLIHGILHVLGYNHEKNMKKAQKMIKKENYYLSRLKKI